MNIKEILEKTKDPELQSILKEFYGDFWWIEMYHLVQDEIKNNIPPKQMSYDKNKKRMVYV